MAQFAAQSTMDLKTVESALAEAERELQRIECEAPAAALRQALGTATDEDRALVARLPELRQSCDSLRMALLQARQLEADRLAAAKVKEAAAAARAATQHLARLEKSMLEASAAIERATSALSRAVDAGRAACALLPGGLRAQYWPIVALSEKNLRDALLVEAVRINRDGLLPPGIIAIQHLVDQQGRIAPLADRVAATVAQIKGALRDNLSVTQSPAPVPIPAADDGGVASESFPRADVEAAPPDTSSAAVAAEPGVPMASIPPAPVPIPPEPAPAAPRHLKGVVVAGGSVFEVEEAQ